MKHIFSSLATVAAVALLPAVVVHAQGRGPQPVVIAEVYDDFVFPTQEFVGTVMPERTAVIGSAVDGRVNEYLISEGVRVEASDPLAKLLDETIRLEVVSAEAELELRQRELDELEAGSRPEEKEQAAAQLQVAEARKHLATQRLERIKKLNEARATSQDDLDEAYAQVIELTATIAERKAAKKLIDDGPRIEKIQQAQARRDMQAAVVQKLKDQHKKHTIITRFAGYIVTEFTEQGAWVNRGDPIAEVAALDNVDIEVHVLESYIPHIQRGMTVEVQIPSLLGVLNPEGKPIVQGQVISIIPKADDRSRTFPVKVRVANKIADGFPTIQAGMLARVTLPIGPRTQNRLVPKDALVLGGASPTVWVVDFGKDRSSGTVRPVPVRPGISSGSKSAIGSELPPGTMVVAEGNERLQPGAAVVVLREIPRPATVSAPPASK